MRIENSLSGLLASSIIGGAVAFLKFRFKNLELTDELIYKTYYELQKFMERSNIDDFTNKDEFIDIMVNILKSVEGAFDEKRAEDPEFIDNLMKKHAWLWDIYKAFSSFVTSKNVKSVKDSRISKEINRQINQKIIKDEVLLDYKVRRDVDYALDDVADHFPDQTTINPIFNDDELRISAPWHKDEN